MRFMRLGEPGAEIPVVTDGTTVWDLRPLTADIDGAFLADDGLTRAEAQVLASALNGNSLAEVARSLGVARSTVKSHFDAIYRKTCTSRQAELVRLAMGFVSPLRS